MRRDELLANLVKAVHNIVICGSALAVSIDLRNVRDRSLEALTPMYLVEKSIVYMYPGTHTTVVNNQCSQLDTCTCMSIMTQHVRIDRFSARDCQMSRC
eukprot:COSAG06_NODE_3492_length_5270_cov_2.545736_6_plen_99_part_00